MSHPTKMRHKCATRIWRDTNASSKLDAARLFAAFAVHAASPTESTLDGSAAAARSANPPQVRFARETTRPCRF